MILPVIKKNEEKEKADLSSQSKPIENKQTINSFCFLAISEKDPDSVAEELRKLCDDFHDRNRSWEFHLVDEKKNEIIYYGHYDKKTFNLNSKTDLRMVNALITLTKESNKSKLWAIREPYDYAWIKKAIDCGLVSGVKDIKHCYTKTFIKYIKSLGVENINIDSKQTFNKYLREVDNKSYPFIFKSHRNKNKMIKDEESKRRNCIVAKFIGLMA